MDKDTENHISQEIEKLAAMVAEGFAHMATKDDLKGLATKEELKTLATKDDLNDLRTDMNDRFDTTNALIGRWTQDVDQLRDRERVLETRMDNLEAARTS